MGDMQSGEPPSTAEAGDGSSMSQEPEEQVTQVEHPSASMSAGEENGPADLPAAAVASATDEVEQVPRALADARERAAAGDVAGAIDAYRGYILNASDTAHARIELARLYESKSEWQLALEQYEAAREELDLLEATLGAASSLAALGRFEAAERELRRAARSHPSNAQVFATSGTIAFRRGQYDEAAEALRRAIDLDPDDGYSYFYRGEALNQLGRVDEALEMLERATQMLPNLGRAWYVMGIVFDKKGRPQEAAAMYRKAREVAAA